MIKIYGIKNCDTMKKAFNWLNNNHIEYVFHDYKKDGLDTDAFTRAIQQHGWEQVINRRGTTWRNLPDDLKNSASDTTALDLALENPSIVKRPLLVKGDNTALGFKPETYADFLGE